MKKTISISLLAALLIMSGGTNALAKSDSSDSSGSSGSSEITGTVRTCMASAVAAREAELAANLSDLHKSISDAYTARASALASAWSGTKTRAEIKAAVKDAWKTFKSSVKSAQASWKSDKKSAWATFKSAAKACKAPSDTDDTSNASTEA